ncbi:MAG: GNAT family N-acetyltransferase [Lachnospiraceae bacterium]|nr:GNAT family N-acetyltransferase [Lachnospiraceae bacterium]
MDYEIVLAKEEDREELLSLYHAQIGREGCPWSEEYPSNETIDFDLSRDALYVYKADNKIYGAMSIEEDEDVNNLPYWNKDLQPESEFARICVLPDSQHKGIGRIMLAFLHEELRRRGYRGIHILVNKLNTKALHLYDRFGYKNVGECFMYDQDFFCYELEL